MVIIDEPGAVERVVVLNYFYQNHSFSTGRNSYGAQGTHRKIFNGANYFTFSALIWYLVVIADTWSDHFHNKTRHYPAYGVALCHCVQAV